MHTHPTILAMIIKARQAELLNDARRHRPANPYRDHRPSPIRRLFIRRLFNRIVIAVADALIAIGTYLKNNRNIRGDHRVEAHAACRTDKTT